MLPDNASPFLAGLLSLGEPAQVVKGGLQAGKVVGAVAKVCGGGGGGKPALAQAGGKDASKLPQALQLAKELMGAGLQQG
jgi:alanyl-tRNA synthetase